ncbi:MAG: cytochrome c biogenesis protein CcdA [Microcoleus sp. PH2017_29_MFU_D_A]|uniref:cytochrome c biogenesis protein CcdA n=1 Tax=unclassified Microcoleus TaxID=2642155 RepID=UPI001E199704|nr:MULTISPECIES: cytochrome c biogenesis protein CcdA [unclassified Microcoleus]MCC3512615.1 cytochrome c biogenesis protein CcdA [Microcoleus sp. PH2017_17_BER_D_A]TAE56197.1 MAG: cytochrome c biogenesis protein CcdA [Oscillatoriales cyanobacterium]MCC3427542.1 cytochrome c biogenesis protein CcdA [Microcoleus sp. PH2017_01_SCD_O_A]MCC3439323.1 cytochrome c biogenesis protein CcdA [Microcoleus sp. PH2017_05_CCC_O_A]MCC3569314.1 cytochrome c biogenesis protein CcdA [Microcoleus sp. PH2017_31_R
MTDIQKREPQDKSTKNFKSPNKWLFLGGLALLGLVLALAFAGPFSQAIEHLISVTENNYQQWFSQQDTANPLVLFLLAFIGGLIASISPCILAMLPVNLSYIGTRNITSKRDAFLKASLFVLGVVTILSFFGLASSFAGAVMVDYRGYINIVVGIIIFIMGFSLLGIVKLPLPGININASNLGPYGVGVTFGLVSSPCASPVLFAVLAAGGATGSQLLGTLTMICYALGYTSIIFLASLLTGFAKQAKTLMQHSESILRFGSVALILTGLYYMIEGVRWFF